jgi:stage II sporulation protein D
VVLTALENKSHCQVQLAGSNSQGRPPLEFQVRGRQVQSSDGRLAKSLTTEWPAPFEIKGRQYLGNLKVEMHQKGGLRVLVQVDLEHYVEGVVSAELPLWSSLPAELQAQAIAVRTYTVAALARQGSHADGFLWDGVQDQAFHGNYLPGPSSGEQSAAVRLRRAVEATRGQILLEDNRLLDVRYHAACGGRTADRASIFPGTRTSAMVVCDPCVKRAAEEAGVPAKHRPLTWKMHLSKPECLALIDRFGLGTRLLKLSPSKIDASGRWQTVRLVGDRRAADVPLDLMRKQVGYGRLKSGRVLSVEPFSGTPNADGLNLVGLGRGHGVGLCQEGLHDYAAQGMTSQAILEHYYPGSRVERLGLDPRF